MPWFNLVRLIGNNGFKEAHAAIMQQYWARVAMQSLAPVNPESKGRFKYKV